MEILLGRRARRNHARPAPLAPSTGRTLALGNLIRVDLPDGRVIEYLVDADQRRVGKKVNGVLQKQWVYADNSRIVAQVTGAGKVVSRFIWADGLGSRDKIVRSVLTRLGLNLPKLLDRLRAFNRRVLLRGPAFMVQNGTLYRVIGDHLGTPRLFANASTGGVVGRLDVDEWGQATNDTSSAFAPFGFASGLLDTEAGLMRFGARDYDAFVSRWTSKDPYLTHGGTNLYGYAKGDPVNSRDIDGTDPVTDAGNCILSVVACVVECTWLTKAGDGNECGNVCSGVLSSCPELPPLPWGDGPRPNPKPNPFAGCDDPADAGTPSCTGPEPDSCQQGGWQ
jgi:RHS repeat-associated protein